MLAVVDEFYNVILAKLERTAAKALIDEDDTIRDSLQNMESSFLALCNYV